MSASSAPIAPPPAELLLDAGPVPLGFVEDDASVFLVARRGDERWPVSVLRAGHARLRLPGRTIGGRVRLVLDVGRRTRVLALFRQKYGERDYLRWYAEPRRVLELTPAGPAGASAPTYYERLTEEFDNVAEEYDRQVLGNRMNRLLRERSLAELRRAFAGASRLLEIGCGSGLETLPLLADGHELLCVDISERMLAVVRRKAGSAEAAGRLATRRLPAGELGRLVPELGPGRFDGAYSTYGALNCEPDLRPVVSAVHDLLRPGAPFVVGVYNRYCALESVGYALSGRPRRAVGRWRHPIPAGDARFGVDVYAHSAPEIARLLRSAGFVPERLEGVPVLLPPLDLVAYADRFARRFETLATWDRRLGGRWPFRALGDHFLLTARRDPAGPPSARALAPD